MKHGMVCAFEQGIFFVLN